MPPASNSAHENHGFYSPSELLELQSSFSSPKIDFWKWLWNSPIRSNMASDDFSDVPEWSGIHFRPPTSFGNVNHFAKKIIFEFFWLFWSNFCFKMKQKWIWKNRKCNFFKNEALNWKSATVKVLGYMLTVSDDCEDPPTMKLAMPLASNSPHEIHGF